MPVWLDAVIRLAPVAAAVLALLGVWLTVQQKKLNDQRDQWWKRVQWAADLVRAQDETSRTVGLAGLTALIGEMDTISPSDAELLQAIIEVVLDPAIEDGDDEESGEDGEPDGTQ